MLFDASSISPAELGRRLSGARRSRNLSQEEAAQHLGVSRPTLVAMEKGTRPAKPEDIIALAALYGRSVHELVRKGTFVTGFAPQFRVTQAADVSEEEAAKAVKEFQGACEDYAMLEDLLQAPMPRYQYPETYTQDRLSPHAAAEEIAQLERARLGLGQGPLANLLDAMEGDIGLRVFVLPLAEFRIAGMFYFTDRLGGCVLVNGTHPPTRQIWSLAHEYAHFLMDRYREDVTVLFEYDRKPRNEQFADSFAACFLMPGAGLRQRFRRIVQSRGDFKVADLCWLADQYGVSVEAMTRRLESLGCVRRGMWEQLSRNVTVAEVQAHLGFGSRKAERLRLPERYRRLAVQAFEEEQITESELMRLLRCSRVESRETVETLTRTSEVAASGEPYQLDLDFGEIVDIDSLESV